MGGCDIRMGCKSWNWVLIFWKRGYNFWNGDVSLDLRVGMGFLDVAMRVFGLDIV